MMNRLHAQLEGAEKTSNVKMPMELSGMSHVGRKPTAPQRMGSYQSGINLDPPKVAARPIPPEFAYTPRTNPQPLPSENMVQMPSLGSIDKPKVSRGRLGNASKTVGLIGVGTILAFGAYKSYQYFSEGDDE